MAERKTSIIYESFYEAVSDLKEQDFIKMMKAYCEYTFYGKEPELKGYLLAMWKLIRPVLEKNNQLYENGSKGGRHRKGEETKPEPIKNQTETKPEPIKNQTETKPEPTPSNDKDVDKDKDKDFDNNSLSLRSREASASAEPTAEEREKFYRIFFLKNFRNPRAEADRFIAHYQATGWVRKGAKIVDRAALAQAWTEQPTTAPLRFPAPFMAWWAEVYEALRARADCGPLFHDLRAVEVTPDRQLVITTRAPSGELRDLLELYMPLVRPILDKHFPHYTLHYRVPRKKETQTQSTSLKQ